MSCIEKYKQLLSGALLIKLETTAVLALAKEVRARINVVFKMTAVTTASETNTVNI